MELQELVNKVLEDSEGDTTSALNALHDGEYLAKIGVHDAELVECAWYQIHDIGQ